MFRPSDKLWLVLSSFFAQGMRIGATLVMARWVSRDDYGLFIVIGAIPGLFSVGDVNIPASLVQMGDDSDLVRDTAVILGSALYVFYATLLIGGSAYLGITHHDWRLWIVGLLMALTNWLNFLYLVRLSELNRRLHFGAESRQNFIYAASQGLSGMLFAFVGLGIFALTLQGLVGQIMASTAIRRRAPLRRPRSFSLQIAKRFISLGGKVSLSSYANSVQSSTTSLTINQMAGEGVAGDFGRAIQVLLLFAQNLMNGLERVAYPTLCQAAKDPPRFRNLVGKVTTLLMLSAGFTAAWLFGTREDLVRLGLGGQWGSVPALLKILAVSIPAYAIYITSYHAVYAVGRTGVLLRSGVISCIVFLPALWMVHRHGVMAIAWAWIGYQFLMGLLNFAWVAVVLRPPVGTIFARSAGFCLTGAVAAAAMRMVYHHLPNAHSFVRFSVCSAAGLLVYGVLVLVTQPQVLSFAWRMARAGKTAKVELPPAPVCESENV